MRPVVTIAANALRRLLRDRSTIFFVFILPMLLVLLIGVQFGGSFRPRLAVALEPGAGPLADDLLARVVATEVFEVVPVDGADEVADAVSRGRAQVGLSLPASYTGDLRSGGEGRVGVVARPDGSGFALEAPIRAAVAEQGALVRAARLAVAEGGGDLDAALTRAGLVAAALPGPGVDTVEVGEDRFADLAQLGRFDLGASGQLVLFVFLTSLTGASTLIQNRQWGVTRRILSTPTHPWQVVAGEALGRFLVAAVQAAYIVLGTALLFGVSWGDPVAAAAVVGAFCLVSAGAAMLLGSILDNDAQAGGLGVFLGIGLAALGGSMAPPELFSDGVRRVAHLVTPHAWANDAFAVLVRHDGGLGDVSRELAVLVGAGVGLLALAAWRLHRTVVRA